MNDMENMPLEEMEETQAETQAGEETAEKADKKKKDKKVDIKKTLESLLNTEKKLEDIDGMGRDVIEFTATGENGVIEPLGLGFLRVENTV